MNSNKSAKFRSMAGWFLIAAIIIFAFLILAFSWKLCAAYCAAWCVVFAFCSHEVANDYEKKEKDNAPRP